MDSPISPTETPHALASQVGGHAGVLTTEDGSLVIKPALPLELQFYQTLQRDPELASLRPFTPKFLGTLKLEGRFNEGSNDAGGSIAITPLTQCLSIQSIVLENLSYGFLKPNILDVKLGTVLYDENAPPEKVERMLKTARTTTSLETGVRLTGFQVHDNNTSQPINTPKSYGKSIRPSQLTEGIAKFFPVGTSSPQVASSEVTPQPPLEPSDNMGLPLRTLLPLIHAIRSDIVEIREAYASLEIRMVGGSLLIVYEGDWVRAEEGVAKLGMTTNENSDSEDNEDEEDEDDEEEEEKPPYMVKLIDFAHTRLVHGAGPDEGVLKGMDTMLRLLDGRIQELGGVVQS